jgi:hypothetical protein
MLPRLRLAALLARRSTGRRAPGRRTPHPCPARDRRTCATSCRATPMGRSARRTRRTYRRLVDSPEARSWSRSCEERPTRRTCAPWLRLGPVDDVTVEISFEGRSATAGPSQLVEARVEHSPMPDCQAVFDRGISEEKQFSSIRRSTGPRTISGRSGSCTRCTSRAFTFEARPSAVLRDAPPSRFRPAGSTRSRR